MWRSLSYRNQLTELQRKLMNWFTCDIYILTGKSSSHQTGNMILRLQSYSYKRQVNKRNIFSINNEGS